MRRPGKSERGLTFITVLIVLGAAAGLYWIFTFVPIYYENHEVTQLMRQAGNIAYQEHNDDRVRAIFLRNLDNEFGYDGTDAAGHSARMSKLEFDSNDLVLQRSQVPPLMRIDFHYGRTLTLPIFGGERHLSFNDHIEQDLSIVKW